MTPLVVRAELIAPLAGHAPQLDALLIWHAGGGWRQPSKADPPPELPAIPLAWGELGGQPVCRCSAPMCEPIHDSVVHIAKRINPDAAAVLLAPDERRVIVTSNTWTRSWFLPMQSRLVDEVVWFCVGDRHQLKSALGEVPAIGKKPAHGHGRVSRWSVEPLDRDLSWYGPTDDGPLLMRALPFGAWLPADLLGYRQDYGAVTPPYWHPDRFLERVVPV